MTQILRQSDRKACNMGFKIHRKSTKTQPRTPGCPFCCSYGFAKLPKLPKWSPRMPKRKHLARKYHVLKTRNDHIGSRFTMFFNDLKPNIQKPASQHFFQQSNLAKRNPNSKTQQASKPSSRSGYCKASKSGSQHQQQPAAANKLAGRRGEASR